MFTFASDSGNRCDFHTGERESGERPELYLQLYFPICVRYGFATGSLREGVTEKGRKLFGMRIEICETGWSAVHKLRVGGGYVGHDLGRKRSVDAVTVFGCVIVEFPAESPFEIDARAMLVSIVETWTGRESAKAVEEQAVGVYGIVHDLYI